MPAFNAESTIASAVRSTLRDLPKDAELVVLDDGSSDGTVRVVEELSDPRLKVQTQPNSGVAASLNALLNSTDSEYVARMDADDVVLPGRFRRQLEALSERNDGGHLDAVFTTVIAWGTGIPSFPRPSGIQYRDFGMHLLLTNPVAHPTLMARRETILGAGGYRNIPSEDYELWLRLARAGARLGRIGIPGLAYRFHANQVTASTDWRRQSWTNPEVAKAYAALSDALLGTSATRITSLSIDESLTVKEKRECFNLFASYFERTLSEHSPAAQRALRRKLAERRVWFEQQIGEDSGPKTIRFTAGASQLHMIQRHQVPARLNESRKEQPPDEQPRAIRAADSVANAAYLKSRLVLRWFRAAQRWRGRRGPLARALFLLIGGTYKFVTEGLLGIELPVSTRVGPGLRLRHGFGVVVNPAASIGSNVMIRQGVTIGNRKARDDCPVIEDDVEIGVGAVIVGAVTVGRGARIGPNAVVFRDVPRGAVVYSPSASFKLPGV